MATKTSYREILKDWVNEWIQEEAFIHGRQSDRGGLRRLSNKFVEAANKLGEEPISYETLRRWKLGILKEELEAKSLRQLAIVRNESEHDTRIWLGVNADALPDQLDALSIKSASPETLVRLIEALTNELHQRLANMTNFLSLPGLLQWAKLQWTQTEINQAFPFDNADRFYELADGDPPVGNDIAMLAAGFTNLMGENNPWNDDALQGLIENNHTNGVAT